MKPDKRQIFTYRKTTIVPQSGSPRYFGCSHGEYLTRWWRVLFGPLSWVLVGTKENARKVIDTTLNKNKPNKKGKSE